MTLATVFENFKGNTASPIACASGHLGCDVKDFLKPVKGSVPKPLSLCLNFVFDRLDAVRNESIDRVPYPYPTFFSSA